jgi:hypothetical protein
MPSKTLVMCVRTSIPADSAKRQIPIGRRGQSTRILRHTRHASSDRSVKRRPFSGRSLIAFSSMTVEMELGTISTNGGAPEMVTVSRAPARAKLDFCYAADVHVILGCDLRRHALDLCAGGVVAGRKKFESESAVGIGEHRIVGPGCGVSDGDGDGGDGSSVGIENGATDGAGRGILSTYQWDRKQEEQNQER